MESRVNTVAVPAIGTNDPATLWKSANIPIRLLIRNTGPTIVFLAHNPAEIQSVGATAGVFQLPAGQEDIFILVPGQGMWAVGAGAGAQVSIAISEAFPFAR